VKAIRLVEQGKPLEAHDVPIPQPGAHDVLIRVKAAGICHSDVHYRAGKSRVHPLPLTLGHEVAGIVEQLGRDVTEFKVGDRVLFAPPPASKRPSRAARCASLVSWLALPSGTLSPDTNFTN
jgi:D-arabinose 1-dehydrogenase-like Zn-dependent alcohol dehydrogenase